MSIDNLYNDKWPIIYLRLLTISKYKKKYFLVEQLSSWEVSVQLPLIVLVIEYLHLLRRT